MKRRKPRRRQSRRFGSSSSRRNRLPKFVRGPFERLEDRWVLAASGIPGNDCAPDLAPPPGGFDPVDAVVGEELTIDLEAAGWTADDGDGDTPIRFQLDPDETPDGAMIDPDTGVITWTPDETQTGTFDLKVIAIDNGTPALADVETVTVNVGARPGLDLDSTDPSDDVDAGVFTEGDAPVILAPNADVDAESTGGSNITSVTVVISNIQDGADEMLSVNDALAAVTGTFSGDTLTIVADDPVGSPVSDSDWNDVLQTVTYENQSDSPTEGTRSITFTTTNDDGVDSATRTATIDVVAVNDAANLTVTDAGATFTEDGGPVSVVTSVEITDLDNTNIESATIEINTIFDTDLEFLDVTTVAGITDSYDETTGILTLTGSASLDDYETVIASLTYENNSDNPDETQRQIDITVNDGTDDSNTESVLVDVLAQNDAAIADLNGEDEDDVAFSATFNESTKIVPQTPGVPIVDSDAVIIDPDSSEVDSVTIEITNQLDGENERLVLPTASQVASISFDYDPANGIATLTNLGTATKADFESVLRAVRYTNDAGVPDTSAARVIDVVVDDGNGNGPASQSTITIVADFNDAPELDDPADMMTSVGVPLEFTANASDPENDNVTFLLDDSAPAGATINPTTGEFSWTPAADQTGTFEIAVIAVDDGNLPKVDTENFIVTVNDPPVMDANVPDTDEVDAADPVLFKIGEDTAVDVLIADDFAVTDSDNDNLESAMVTLTGIQEDGIETLTIDDGLALALGVNVQTDDTVPGEFKLNLTAGDPIDNPVSKAEWEQLLETVDYEYDDATQLVGDRTVAFTVNDGKIDSAPANVTVTVNDMPMVDLNGGDGGENFAADFNVGTDTTIAAVDGAATITDDTDDPIQMVTITIETQDGVDEDINVTESGSVTANKEVDGSTITITLMGGLTNAEFAAVLQSLMYNNSAATPMGTERVITVVANDGKHDSNEATSTISFVFP